MYSSFACDFETSVPSVKIFIPRKIKNQPIKKTKIDGKSITITQKIISKVQNICIIKKLNIKLYLYFTFSL